MTATASTQPATGALPWGSSTAFAPLPDDVAAAEVVVVGAGLAGLSVAYELLARRPDADVLVLDAHGPGAGATGRSTGMLTPGVGQDLPGQLRRWGAERTKAIYELTLDAVCEAAALIEHEEIACDLVLGGQLIVARGRGGRRRLARLASVFETLELPAERLDRDGLEARLHLAPSALSAAGEGPAALRLSTAGTLNPLALANGLAERVARRGARLYQARVARLEPGALLLSDGRRIEAGQVVLAAAGLAGRLGVQQGRVWPVRLRALATEPLSVDALTTLGWSDREGVIDSRRLFDYFRLTTDGRIVFGGGRPGYRFGGAGSEALDDREAEQLCSAFRACFPPEVAPPVAATWAGTIGYTLDGVPAIGPLPGLPDVLHVGGWCGHGIALSLAAGRWAAQLLTEGQPPAGPWLRSSPPFVPTQTLRWLGFHGVVSLMALSDRL